MTNLINYCNNISAIFKNFIYLHFYLFLNTGYLGYSFHDVIIGIGNMAILSSIFDNTLYDHFP